MNKPRTTTIQQPSQLFSLLTNSTLNVNTLRICTDEVMEAVTTSIEENVNKGSKTNIFIAAFTTCHARLTLYESLDLLQEQVLYYDTDSVNSNANSNLFTLSDYIMFLMATMYVLSRLFVPSVAV